MNILILKELDEINESLKEKSCQTTEKLTSLNERRKELRKKLDDDIKENQDDFNKYWNIAQKSVYNNKLAIAN